MNIDGKRVLVVEDDYFLARELRDAFEEHGARVIGPAPTAFYGQSLLGRRGVDFAVLDVCLHGELAYDLAAELQRRSTPFIFSTALDPEKILPAYRGVPLVQKPAPLTAILERIRLIEQPANIPDPILLSEDAQLIRMARVVLKAIQNGRPS